MGKDINIINGVETRVEKREIRGIDFLEYEKWLEELELEGWNLQSIMYDKHTFVKGNKRRIRYCFDQNDKMTEEYIQMFKDFGWKLIFTSNLICDNEHIYLWAMEYEGERPEAFNNIERLEEQNNEYKNKLKKFVVSSLLFGAFCFIAFPDFKLEYLILYYLLVPVGILFNLEIKGYKFIKTYKKNRKLIESYKVEV